ncbi:hypothetical protein Tco_1256290 [Tanacetum coccineum]
MNKAGTKLSKLDRFLITEDVLDSTPDIRITALDHLWSDHTPILLYVLKSDFGPTPFKFYISWLFRDDFNDIQKAMLDLKSIDKKIDDGTVTQFDRDNRTKLLQDIDKFDNLEAHDLIQKAHIKWDIEGDENSKFFHGMINQKRRTQAITGIMHDGVWISDPLLIKEIFLNFFKDKFQAYDSQVVFSPLALSTGLCTCNRDSLETSVSCDEIKTTIWDCGSNKSPGPDGFSFAFIKNYWDLLKTDICGFVNFFFKSGSMPQGANSSFSCLFQRSVAFDLLRDAISAIFGLSELKVSS